MDAKEQNSKIVLLGSAFSPGAPINKQDLFAGRINQLNEVLTAVAARGRHVVVFGERGVGKTSLARILADVARGAGLVGLRTGTLNCSVDDDFNSVWRKVFRDLAVVREVQGIGFQSETKSDVVTLERVLDAFSPDAPATPDDVRQALGHLGECIIIIDELDRIRHDQFSGQLADTLKTLSDHSVPATVVLVGVADSIDELIAEHASVERSITQVHMPRMSRDELVVILEKGYEAVGMSVDPGAAARIAALSRGLPHFTHLLGQQAGIRAVRANESVVSSAHISAALASAVRNTAQSIQRSYHEATFSPRTNTHHPAVLLACALVPTDDLGFFAASDVRAPLSKIMGRDVDIPAFAKHLNDFSSSVRGPVLQKVGTTRRFRYRFINPLLQPFVILKGVEEGRVTDEMLAQSEYARPR